MSLYPLVRSAYYDKIRAVLILLLEVFIMPRQYDFIVSLGENCISSGNLRRNKLQYESFPFDWIGITLEQAVRMLKTHFKNFLELQNLQLSARAENHDRYMDVIQQIEFVHDFDSDTDPSVNFEKVKNKYFRRIERLFQRMDEARSILFVISSNRHIEDEILRQQWLELHKLCPQAKVDLICFELPQGDKSVKKCRISDQIQRFVLTSPNPNDWNALRDDYTECLKPFKLKAAIRFKYFWPDFCFHLKKQLLKAGAVLIPIPEIRRRLRQKVKKNVFE